MSSGSAPWQKRVYSCIIPRGQPSRVFVPDDIEIRTIHAPCVMCGQRDACRHRSEG